MELEFYSKKEITDRLYAVAKSRAKIKGLEFSISKEDIKVPTFCPILKIELVHAKGMGRQPNAASIDRIDSTQGYIKGNIQIISDLANRMKAEATIPQLKQFANWALGL